MKFRNDSFQKEKYLYLLTLEDYKPLYPSVHMEYKFINTEYLDSVSGDDDSTMCEIISIFKDQVVEIRNEMKTLHSEHNYYSLGLLAHKAKSSVAIMGMENLAAMLKSFELEAKEGKETEKYGYYISRFENETTEAVKELDDLLSKRLNRDK